MLGILRKFCNSDMEMNFVGGMLFMIIMSFLILLEFALSGFMFEYTPRFDIIYMLVLCSRRIKISCLSLLCAGIFRDIVYILPVTTSAMLYVFLWATLDSYRVGTSRESLKVIALIHGVLWAVNCIVYREIASIKYLIFQILVCSTVVMLSGVRRRIRSNA